MTLASLPIVTAGAALSTGSGALRHYLEHGKWPGTRAALASFRRRLLPGLMAGPGALLVAFLITLDLRGLHRGAVPGGPAMIGVVLAIAALIAGWAGVVVVLAGADVPSPARRAMAVLPCLAATGVLLFAVVLGFLVHPVLVVLLPGYVLFALHAVVARFPLR